MIGKFSESTRSPRHTGLNTGGTSIDLNTGDNTHRNTTIPVHNDIGKAHDPTPRYVRISDVKSAGGYAVNSAEASND